MGHYIATMHWNSIRERLVDNAVAILPVGAACKEHGPHLPMQTDLLQAQWLCDQLADQYNVLIWPTVSYGFYPHFIDYAGSCSLDEETFTTMIASILQSMKKSGAKNIVILNTGISTIDPICEAIKSLTDHVVRLINVYSGANYLDASKECIEESCGGHADEEETSIMLAMYPNLVDMSLAGKGLITEKIPGPFSASDKQNANYAPNGIYGDPRKATSEKGQKLVKAMMIDVVDNIEDLLLSSA